MSLPPLKLHQDRSLSAIDSVRSERKGDMGTSLLMVAPPGAGKSRVMVELAEREVARGGRPLLKVHRRMLLRQMIEVFRDAGHDVGVIAPDYEANNDAPILIASSQTMFSRAVCRGTIELPEATLVVNDEAHQQGSKMERALVFGSYSNNTVQEGYLNRGVDVIGFTATPLMSSRIYQSMIDFATYSELRDIGMHQLVGVYGPDEIDTNGLRVNAAGEYSETELDKRVAVIFGSVYREWKRLNPLALPAILFAPSVASSQWFAYEFMKKGVPVAHMDAARCLLPNGNGQLEVYPSTPEVREEVLRMSRDGEVKVVMNRFLLREAIDMPWLYHGIFATVLGSPTTALQSVGRLQRFWPAYSMKILQDHGGFYWRHGSPNSDRHWKLGLTNKQYAKERIERILRGDAREGIRCPKCGFWRYSGQVCLNPECRHSHMVSVRAVRMLSGRLKKMEGTVYRKANQKAQADKIWMAAIFACANSGKAVSEAVSIACDRARQTGVVIDWNQVKCKPPQSDDVRWHYPAKKVFPWAVKVKAKAPTS